MEFEIDKNGQSAGIGLIVVSKLVDSEGNVGATKMEFCIGKTKMSLD